MRLEQADRLNGVQPGVIHPVVGGTEPSQIVSRVVTGVVIEMGNLKAGSDLQAANGAAPKGVSGIG